MHSVTILDLGIMHLTYHPNDRHKVSASTADAGGAGAPGQKWTELLADDVAISLMAMRLMDSVSEEAGSVSLVSLERTKEMLIDLILAAAEGEKSSL